MTTTGDDRAVRRQPLPPSSPGGEIDELREILLGSQERELAELRQRVTELEALVARSADRAKAVGEILPEAFASHSHDPAELGTAMRQDVEHAVLASARNDSGVLAEALYPVLGPAMRKMIASIFSLSQDDPGKTFRVEQVLLIERRTGILLAATAHDGDALSDADIVSGMLDAIRLFVQDAFGKAEHDGLQDLRVGDTSVLVEWGPRAVLASVITGIPNARYRTNAEQTLELIHKRFEPDLVGFNGDIEPFEATTPLMASLNKDAGATSSTSFVVLAVGLVLLALIIAVLVAFS